MMQFLLQPTGSQTMRKFNKVWGIGLPRSAGQTLQQALSILLPGDIFHSPGNQLERCMLVPGIQGAVEVFHPIPWLKRRWPDSLFIFNHREDADAWLQSCAGVYHKSENWNNPIWRYPLDAFPDYRSMYCTNRLMEASGCGWDHGGDGMLLEWDFLKDPCWGPLCEFFEAKTPDQPFPNIDNHGESATRQQPPGPLTNPFVDEWGMVG